MFSKIFYSLGYEKFFSRRIKNRYLITFGKYRLNRPNYIEKGLNNELLEKYYSTLAIDLGMRCHLDSGKTVVTPAIYKGLYYHFTVYCAHRHPIRLYDLERADISFMPTGRTPTYDRIPQSFGGERFLRRQRIEDWEGGDNGMPHGEFRYIPVSLLNAMVLNGTISTLPTNPSVPHPMLS